MGLVPATRPSEQESPRVPGQACGCRRSLLAVARCACQPEQGAGLARRVYCGTVEPGLWGPGSRAQTQRLAGAASFVTPHPPSACPPQDTTLVPEPLARGFGLATESSQTSFAHGAPGWPGGAMQQLPRGGSGGGNAASYGEQPDVELPPGPGGYLPPALPFDPRDGGAQLAAAAAAAAQGRASPTPGLPGFLDPQQQQQAMAGQQGYPFGLPGALPFGQPPGQCGGLPGPQFNFPGMQPYGMPPGYQPQGGAGQQQQQAGGGGPDGAGPQGAVAAQVLAAQALAQQAHQAEQQYQMQQHSAMQAYAYHQQQQQVGRGCSGMACVQRASASHSALRAALIQSSVRACVRLNPAWLTAAEHPAAALPPHPVGTLYSSPLNAAPVQAAAAHMAAAAAAHQANPYGNPYGPQMPAPYASGWGYQGYPNYYYSQYGGMPYPQQMPGGAQRAWCAPGPAQRGCCGAGGLAAVGCWASTFWLGPVFVCLAGREVWTDSAGFNGRQGCGACLVC